MDKTFLDECFKARMDYLQKRFPIESFRRLFKQQYVRNGLVMIQPIMNKDMDDVMIADSEAGFIFNSEHNLDVALRLLRLWGFNVTMRREHDERKTSEQRTKDERCMLTHNLIVILTILNLPPPNGKKTWQDGVIRGRTLSHTRLRSLCLVRGLNVGSTLNVKS